MPTSTHRARNKPVRPALVALAVALSLLASGGGSGTFELTLRSRAAPDPSSGGACIFGLHRNLSPGSDGGRALHTCALAYGARQWVGDGGRMAISRPHTETTSFTFNTFAAVVCAGRQLPPVFWTESTAVPTAGGEGIEFEFDDGNGVSLEPEHGLAAASYTDLECFEVTGRWRGTAGNLSNRTGSYTMTYNSIQTVLRLVED